MKKNILIVLSLLCLSSFCLVVGGCCGCCGADERYAGPSRLDAGDIASAAAVGEDVLIGLGFEIDKSDAKLGIVQTAPLPGAKSFEFWRKDNVSACQKAYSNIHNTRKIARLEFAEKQGVIFVDCSVDVQRLHLPQADIDSSSKTHSMFSKSSTSLQRFKLTDKQKSQAAWIEAGEDTALANRIIQRISKRMAASK